MPNKSKRKLIVTRKKSVLPLKVKVEMLDRLRLGQTFASVARSYDVNESTVRSIKKSEDKIRSSIASNFHSAKIVRSPALEKMEAALSVWMEDRNQKRVLLSAAIIREKAKQLYEHFKQSAGDETNTGFQASMGWFNKFKARQSLHNVQIVGEAASANTVATAEHPEEFVRLFSGERYNPEQVLNADDTGLFGKSKPNKTRKSKVRKTSPAKDRVALLETEDPAEEAETSSQMMTMTLENLSEGLKLANDLSEFFMNIDPRIERSLIFKRKIEEATSVYRSELKQLLNEAKQKKITVFFKPITKLHN